MKHQSSLAQTAVAPVEVQFTWKPVNRMVSATGRVAEQKGTPVTIWGYLDPAIRMWPIRFSGGTAQIADARIYVRGTCKAGDVVEYPDIKIGDRLVGADGRTWEVLQREIWDRVALLVLTVREVR